MKLFLGGVRGGSPIADPAYARYGGDTSSFLIEGEAGERLIIDAGTGLRLVYDRLKAQDSALRSVLMLFSHFHLDHVSGLPAFPPLYDEEWTVELAARVFDDLSVEDIAYSFVHPPIWPLPLSEMKAGKIFRILDVESMEQAGEFGGLRIRWCPVHHPGGSTAFRIEEPATGGALVIATDIEWAESSDEEKMLFERLCGMPEGADLLVFDGKCAPDDYEAYRGWGHSTWLEGIEIAQRCGVKQLLVTHHDTDMDDDACDRRDAQIRESWVEARLAKQGEVVNVKRSSPT